MKLIRNINQIKSQLPALSLTIGNFDGLHLGHLEIINQVKKSAAKNNLSSAILTFEPHPIAFLRPDLRHGFRLNSLSEKLRKLMQENLDYIIILPFNAELSKLSASDFIHKILIAKLNVKHLIIGYDFTFGNNREGNFKLLEQKAKNNFALSEISAIKNNDYTCSSSIIRNLIREGNIALANQILGHNFTISGHVVTGKKLARQLGFPTMNIRPNPEIVRPKFGVYKTVTYIPSRKEKFNSITNFGIKPTFGGEEAVFETHIPGFEGEVYGKRVVVEFVEFVREEMRFGSVEELVAQVKCDVGGLGGV